MNKVKFTLLAAGFVLAMVFTFSCSDDGGGNNNTSNCGGKEYDATVYTCDKGELVGFCRGNSYYPEYQYCDSNGEIKEGTEISSSSLSSVGSSSSSSSAGGQGGGSSSSVGGGQSSSSSSSVGGQGGSSSSSIGGGQGSSSSSSVGGIAQSSSSSGLCTGFNPETHFCLDNIITPLCGDRPFTSTFTSSQFCSGNSVYNKCNGTEIYTPETESCCGDIIISKASHYCYNNSKVWERCSQTPHNTPYNPDLYKCVDNSKIYLKIPVNYERKDYNAVFIAIASGSYYGNGDPVGQIWMVENLNYAVPGSKCGNGSTLSDNNTTTCDTYGRLYDWATAMGLDARCNVNSCSSQIQSKHRGICPSGWHLPSKSEWEALYNAVGGSSTAGRELKAGSRWNPYSGIENLDTYGFSALPGGGGNSDGSFGSVGDVGGWWSTSETGSSVYRPLMRYSEDNVITGSTMKDNLTSVRCLQDYH